MLDFIENHIVGILILVLLAVVSMCIWASVVDDQQWRVYATEHHCREAGQKAATTGIGTGVTANGNVGMVTTYNPAQTIYRCDNDEIQIR